MVHLETSSSLLAASGKPKFLHNSFWEILRLFLCFVFCGYIDVKLGRMVWCFDTDVHSMIIKSDNFHNHLCKYLSLLCGKTLWILSCLCWSTCSTVLIIDTQQNTRTYSSHPALTLYPNILSSPFVVNYIYILRLLSGIKDLMLFWKILFLYNHFLQMNLPSFFQCGLSNPSHFHQPYLLEFEVLILRLNVRLILCHSPFLQTCVTECENGLNSIYLIRFTWYWSCS